jgi:hypothetical protein
MRARAVRRDAWSDGRIAFFLLLVLAVVWEVLHLFGPETRIRVSGEKPFVVTEFASGVPVGQTFRAMSNGLDGVDLQFSADRPTSLRLTCRLLTWGDYTPGNWAPLYEWTETRRLPRGNSRQHFVFRPVVPSVRQIYQFQVQQIEAQPLDAPAGERATAGPMASLHESPKDGNVILGTVQMIDRHLWYEVHAADSVFDHFRRYINPQLPKWLRRPAVQVTLLAFYNVVLAVFAFHMLVGPSSIQLDPHD